MKSLAGTLSYWNLMQWFNYGVLDQSWRTTASLVESIPWVVILSTWSLRSGRTVAEKELQLSKAE